MNYEFVCVKSNFLIGLFQKSVKIRVPIQCNDDSNTDKKSAKIRVIGVSI